MANEIIVPGVHIASRELMVEAVQMWLMGCREESVCAVLGCELGRWKEWQGKEGFRYLVGVLTDPVRGFLHGQFTRLTMLAMERVEQMLTEGVPVYDMKGEKRGMRPVSPKEVAALSVMLVDKQGEIEKRRGAQVEMSEEVAALWEKLEAWSKANPVKGREKAVIDVEVESAD